MIGDVEVLKGHFWVAFGSQNSTISIIPLIHKGDYSNGINFIGLTYHKYELCEEETVSEMNVDELGEHTSVYCLMLPFRDKKKELRVSMR